MVSSYDKIESHLDSPRSINSQITKLIVFHNEEVGDSNSKAEVLFENFVKEYSTQVNSIISRARIIDMIADDKVLKSIMQKNDVNLVDEMIDHLEGQLAHDYKSFMQKYAPAIENDLKLKSLNVPTVFEVLKNHVNRNTKLFRY